MKHLKTQLALLSIVSLTLIFPLDSWGQNGERVYRKLTTLQMQKALEESDSTIFHNRQEIEQFTDSVKAFLSPSPQTLPLVFHILNKVGGQNLVSQSEVEAQIEALNRDFNNLDYEERHLADTREGFNQLVADMEISFCLANLNGGLPSIHYVNGLQGEWPPDNSIKDPNSGGIAPWHPDQVINVWVADLTEDVSGFAQMPGGPSSTDGIVIDYRFFGTGPHTESSYNQGKTLTHLVGNYLNLYDLWGQGTNCSDDQVLDTPIHNSENKGCPAYKHMTMCKKGGVEMIMNFMDNTDDACMYMFTNGQKQRVHILFHNGGPRETLVYGDYSTCDSVGNQRLTDPNSPLNSSSGEKIYVYPNPAQNSLFVGISAFNSGNMEVIVFSSIGAKVFEEVFPIETGTQEFQIKCQNWAAGIYFIQTLKEGISETLQITVN